MFLTKLRLTSAMRTCSMTCNGVAVLRRDRTLVSPPTNAWVSRSASAASAGPATVPVSSTRPFIGVATMRASGMARPSIRCTSSRLSPTRTVAVYRTWPDFAVAEMVVSPVFLPKT